MPLKRTGEKDVDLSNQKRVESVGLKAKEAVHKHCTLVDKTVENYICILEIKQMDGKRQKEGFSLLVQEIINKQREEARVYVQTD